MPLWAQAGLWGLLSGGTLVVGAAVAWWVRVPRLVIAGVMAFGAGVLISALAFDLVDEAETTGGLGPAVGGLALGATTYVAANLVLNARGARHRKRSGDQQPSEDEQAGSGTAIAVGALLDGIPESTVLGLSLTAGHGVGVAVLAAIVISNLPEGLSSSAGMKRKGRSAGFVFGVWGAIAVASGIAALLGYALLDGAPTDVVAVITAVAAGAILAMVADTMVPEAFERTHVFNGAICTAGFIVAFAISRS
ncbi:ZIP family metal transporter [Nocardioides rubriscoriae]|uniref:ZIP family metal transporter n=1 Tax=Nocardioides rubriscoriae TaxID=642762 RepID=UPI0011DF0F48|nr:ZIP family zinc transporter [Nocardioides rubriscoriae]